MFLCLTWPMPSQWQKAKRGVPTMRIPPLLSWPHRCHCFLIPSQEQSHHDHVQHPRSTWCFLCNFLSLLGGLARLPMPALQLDAALLTALWEKATYSSWAAHIGCIDLRSTFAFSFGYYGRGQTMRMGERGGLLWQSEGIQKIQLSHHVTNGWQWRWVCHINARLVCSGEHSQTGSVHCGRDDKMTRKRLVGFWASP